MNKQKGNVSKIRSEALSLAKEIEELKIKSDNLKSYYIGCLIAWGIFSAVGFMDNYALAVLTGLLFFIIGIGIDLRRSKYKSKAFYRGLYLLDLNFILASNGEQPVTHPFIKAE